MADRPILFSAPMVRALLAGMKTQTRRVIKPQPAVDFISATFGADGSLTVCPAALAFSPTHKLLRRLHRDGDRLWVKEGWCDEHPLAIQAGRYSQPGTAGIPGPPPVSYRTIYRVDGEPLHIWRSASLQHPYFTLDGPANEIDARYPTISSNFRRADGKGVFWDSARYMPRRASRLTLIISEVRVQRLQHISEEDAVAEGIEDVTRVVAPRDPSLRFWKRYRDGGWNGYVDTAKGSYASLWTEINGAGSWEANPWVAVYTFTVHQQNIDAMEKAA